MPCVSLGDRVLGMRSYICPLSPAEQEPGGRGPAGALPPAAAAAARDAAGADHNREAEGVGALQPQHKQPRPTGLLHGQRCLGGQR